jgi:hypothetical protein
MAPASSVSSKPSEAQSRHWGHVDIGNIIIDMKNGRINLFRQHVRVQLAPTKRRKQHKDTPTRKNNNKTRPRPIMRTLSRITGNSTLLPKFLTHQTPTLRYTSLPRSFHTGNYTLLTSFETYQTQTRRYTSLLLSSLQRNPPQHRHYTPTPTRKTRDSHPSPKRASSS